MKIGDKDYQVRPDPATQMLKMEVKVWGIALASEDVTPDQARQFASLLVAAADLAEGVG